MLRDGEEIAGSVVNVAGGKRSSLNRLLELLRERIPREPRRVGEQDAVHEPPRRGDVRHSEADLSRARTLLGFNPRYDLGRGLDATVAWFRASRERAPKAVAVVTRSLNTIRFSRSNTLPAASPEPASTSAASAT